MRLINDIPLAYTGELHAIKLIQFSVDPEEVQELLPEPIPLRLVDGRALISMVDVNLQNMQALGLPEPITFGYRHLGFRLLVDDRKWSGDYNGVFFIRSFAEKPSLSWGGSFLSDYRIGIASMEETDRDGFRLEQDGNFLRYRIQETRVVEKNPWLKGIIGNLNKAYSQSGTDTRMIRIQRERWPLQEIVCAEFETNFFRTARLEGAFCVPEIIQYHWEAPELIG